MADSELVRFNIQNAKYALKNEDGTYEAPVDFGTSTKISLEANSSTKEIYGDGRTIANIVSDKGQTVTLTLNTLCVPFEIAMGRKEETKNGVADIAQNKTPEFALYFETISLQGNSKQTVAKTWMYGMTSATRPTEEYDQTEDEINESTFEIEFSCVGTAMLDSDGQVVIDDAGNEILVFRQTATVGDEGYDDYGKAVVVPMRVSD